MRIGRLVMGVFYVVAGAGHFVATRTYLHIMPDYLPDPRGLVLLTGGCEICGGVGVLMPQTRRVAAWGIVTLLVAFLPVHIWLLQHHKDRYAAIPLWTLWARLPLQAALIGWAWLYTRPDETSALTPGKPAIQ